MGINKDWMKEDNIEQFGKLHDKQLYEFLYDVFIAIVCSVDGGRRFTKPGQAIEWYMSRLSPEKAEYIRNNLTTEHINALWDEVAKGLIEESAINSPQNIVQKHLQIAKHEKQAHKIKGCP